MTDQVQDAPKVEDTAAPAAPAPVTEQQAPAPEVNEVEDRARAQGWVPKDEWTGDPAQWRPADVYVDRGELLGKIKSQSAELREVKGMMTYLTEQNRRLYEAGYQKAIADLEAQRDQAVEEGNSKAVREIDKQIRAHEKALEDTNRTPIIEDKAAAVQAAQERFEAFKGKNTWYEKDEVMHDWANGAAVKFKSANPRATDEDIYKHLTETVRVKFPDKFKKVGAPSPDGRGDRGGGSPPRKAGDTDFDNFVSTLSDSEASIARNLVKRGHVTKEQFMQSIKQLGGRL
jgi:hypothetical protein